jgi:hypothetical protein
MLRDLTPPEVPEYEAPPRVVWAGQSWTPEERAEFHSTSQGTATIPFPREWLEALEQPGILEKPLLLDRGYMSRLGFLYEPDAAGVALPIGFVPLPVEPGEQPRLRDPVTGKPLETIGFTCAACHTGQLDYRSGPDDPGVAIRIEGGAAPADLGAFRKAMGLAVLYTTAWWSPGRFDRFATRVLGEEATSENKRALREVVAATLAASRAHREDQEVAVLGKWGHYRRLLLGWPTPDEEEGPGRLDAIGRIGNFLFGLQLSSSNYRALRAPVSFPALWHAPWFDWVQYNGSIMQPLVRNLGEALGVSAYVNLSEPTPSKQYASLAAVDGLVRLEELVAGRQPFEGLSAPRWESVPELPPLDPAKVSAGKAQYAMFCERCHQLPVSELQKLDPTDLRWKRYWWRPGDPGYDTYFRSGSYLRLKVRDVGTDPSMAREMKARLVQPYSEGRQASLELDGLEPVAEKCRAPLLPDADGSLPFGPLLGAVVEKTVERWHEEHGTSAADRARLNGARRNCIRAVEKYKARLLDGVWATAPYLHNGSVPNLYLLLGSEAERDAKGFWAGSREFDPVDVGVVVGARSGLERFDSDRPGNSNAGHEFREGQDGAVVGPPLSEDQRRELIEYLKSL